jgi:two-component system cell cycle response regulator
MTHLIAKEGYSGIQFTSAYEAYEYLKQAQEPVVLLLDWVMPGMNGVTLCELIRNTDVGHQPFIIMITNKDSLESQLQALDMGADLFLSKPVEPKIIYAQLKVANRIISQQMETDKLNKELKELANIDGLTAIPNRRFGLERISKQLARLSRQTESQGCLILCDIDLFKNINDTYGHGIGDAVLIEFCERITHQIRPFDDFCRYGGEEFLLFCEISDLDMPDFIERLRRSISAQPFSSEGNEINVTASFGAMIILPTDVAEHTMEALIDFADKALYQAKNDGRNRVILNSTGKHT